MYRLDKSGLLICMYLYICIVAQIDRKSEPVHDESEINLCPVQRDRTNCTIFLGYTSNLISSGVREVIRYLAEHNLVSNMYTGKMFS